ncbi:hypothetical protein [Bacillus thuringiensis]|uniref:Uncharacterized protein n=1 Tax=Bacillus thuringiensis TaxID=1428 RepID=A0A9X6Z5R0_BACTU|nr:hypothetical protein [Bacillus thuringiensis]MEC3272629.1 hypothetical protein [Bacillus thuringiensis]PFB09122.1 hypothetical protein CN398_05665 [Bacillus thuringiensis]
MTYKEAWNEQKAWLINSMNYLKERIANTSGKEKKRLQAKLDGMNVAYQHMVESDTMYQFESE